MKLLFDHNLSPRLVPRLSDLFPDSAHVRDFDLHQADDLVVWQFAVDNDYVIVSKDSDFHQLAFVKGPPPKVIWVQRGNCSTEDIHELLRESEPEIEEFVRDDVAAFLVLR